MRELTVNEIAQLEERNCWAEEWSDVLVDEAFNPSQMHNVTFYGHIEIGSLNGTLELEDGFRKRCGIRNATLRNITIGDDCLIENIHGYISNYQIGDQCYISNVSLITCQEGSSFGNGLTISVLNEGGEGNVCITKGLTAQIAWLMVNFPSVKDLAVHKKDESMSMHECGYIGSGSRILNVKEISNVYIGEGCEVQGSSRLNNCTIQSTDDAGTLIGTDVIIEDSVVAPGASIIDGAKVYSSFIGESVHIGKGFSAEASLFFANSHMDNGESCAAFCGPFSTSHHKSTLLIGGAFSFYNAGSSTNQSNHAYKMGPIHYGIMEHGAKTASGAHILWPAHIGAFSMCMGKIANHPDTSAMPFSYIIGDGKDTYIVPGRNLTTAGTYRDINKWPKRDIRPKDYRHSILDASWLNAYSVGKMIKAKFELERMLDKQGRCDIYECADGCLIKKTSLHKGISLYSMAIKMFLAGFLNADNVENDNATTAYSEDKYAIDLSGLLISQQDVLNIVEAIQNGDIDNIADLKEALDKAAALKEENERCLAANIADRLYGWQSLDHEDRLDFIDSCRQARLLWLSEIRKDAEKEYEMGDVDKGLLNNFISKLV